MIFFPYVHCVCVCNEYVISRLFCRCCTDRVGAVCKIFVGGASDHVAPAPSLLVWAFCLHMVASPFSWMNCFTCVSVLSLKVIHDNGTGEKVVKIDMLEFVEKWTSHVNDSIVAKAISMTFISLSPKVNRKVCHICSSRVCGHPHFGAVFCWLGRRILSEQ